MSEKRRSIEDRIEQLEARQKQDAALLARLKARKNQTERKQDTRRKILVGALVLNKARQSALAGQQLTKLLDEGLSAPRDRALFPELTPKLAADNQNELLCPNISAPKPAPRNGSETPS